jgi:hypothetical protein
MSETTSRTTPAPEAPATPPTPGRASPPRRPVGLIVALVVAIAVIAALTAVILWPDDEDGDTSTATTEPPATSITPSPPTSGETTPSTSAAPTTAAVDASTAVFPHAGSATRYADPVAAARAFATDFVGFTDPVVGEFMPGDARSGEVDVQPLADGPVTTVFVRQLGTDASWWVLGSATADIVVDSPSAGDTVTSPAVVSGTALAWEGVVGVEVRQDGSRAPLGSAAVTGGGDVPRPFSGQIAFSPPTVDHGALVFLTHSAEDGRVWEAAVIRLRFA